MTNDELRKELEDYINSSYKYLYSSAKSITKSDGTEGDLLNSVLLDILDRKHFTPYLHNCTNFYNYIYRSMVKQFYSNNSNYSKNYRKYYELVYDLEQKDEEYDDNFEKMINFIEKYDFFNEEMLEKIQKNKKREIFIRNEYKMKNILYKKMFFEYFYPEIYSGDLKNVENINSIRKTSYDKIAFKYGISKSSVYQYIKTIINILGNSDIIV